MPPAVIAPVELVRKSPAILPLAALTAPGKVILPVAVRLRFWVADSVSPDIAASAMLLLEETPIPELVLTEDGVYRTKLLVLGLVVSKPERLRLPAVIKLTFSEPLA